MLTLFHGDDISRSRKEFLSLRDTHSDSLSFDGKSLTITDITQVFDGGRLFEETKTVFIENLISQKKESSELAAIRDYLSERAATHTIYIWENKELTKAQLAKLHGVVARHFKLPQSLFQFLEYVKPGTGTRAITLFHESLVTNEPEMIFFMLVRHIRILLALRLNDSIDELKRLTWQRGKMLAQAQAFDTHQLMSFYKQLAEIDTGMKTGTLGGTLDTTIDMLLLEL